MDADPILTVNLTPAAAAAKQALAGVAPEPGVPKSDPILVADKPEKEKAPAMPGGGADMDF